LTEVTDNWLVSEQHRDSEIQDTTTKLRNHELPGNSNKTYELRKELLHRKIQRNGKTKCLPVISRAFRWAVINHVHESIMHLGWEKTLDKAYGYYWPNIWLNMCVDL